MTAGLASQTVAEASYRAEYAALPWRMSGEGTMEVLLIRQRQEKRWTVPSGPRSGTRTEFRAAERAAFQHAGVTGRLAPAPVGRFLTTLTLADGRKDSCEVTVFGLHVWGTLVNWPDETKVLRRWMPLSEARALAADSGLAELLVSVMSGATVQDPEAIAAALPCPFSQGNAGCEVAWSARVATQANTSNVLCDSNRSTGGIMSPRKAHSVSLHMRHVHGEFHQGVEAYRERAHPFPEHVASP